MEYIKFKTIEVVGIRHGSNGRVCGLHTVSCGSSVQVGTRLKLHNAIIKVPIEKEVPIINVPVEETLPKKRGRKKKVIQQLTTEVVMTDVATIKAFIWENAVESCCVGFVSLVFQGIYENNLDGRIVEVTRVLDKSDSESERQRSLEHNGMIQCIVIG